MSHARIEEVSDSDLSDPEEVDIDDFADAEIMRRVPDLTTARPPQPAAAPAPAPKTAFLPDRTMPASTDRSAYNDFQCLYPVYFDASRTRAEGRRVSAALAVRNPLAREIATACSRLRLPTLFEPEKTHPKDWANPGRVRVGLGKRSPTTNVAPVPVRNKHHLFKLIAEHLRANPTTENSEHLRTRIAGVVQPEAGKPYPRPAVPRGWKINELVPFLSPAMTGGGVSENLFKDMMKEMQSGGDPMAALMGAQGGGGGEESGAARKKKEKKGKGRA